VTRDRETKSLDICDRIPEALDKSSHVFHNLTTIIVGTEKVCKR